MKKLLSALIVLSLVLTAFPINAFAADISANEFNPMSATAIAHTITISESNLSEMIATYDIPEEVANCISQKIANSSLNQQISVIVPYSLDDFVPAVQRSSGSWSPIRIYNGYELTDWVVTESNGYSMTTIRSSAHSNNILSFCGSIVTYLGSVVLDRVSAFGSAAITACQFILGLDTNVVNPTSGDKLQAAPRYTCYDTFTYVQLDGQKYLGAHTYYVNLQSISWYAYSASENVSNTKTETRSNWYASTNYNNRSAAAVQNYSLGGLIDNSVSIKIGDVYFYLS